MQRFHAAHDDKINTCGFVFSVRQRLNNSLQFAKALPHHPFVLYGIIVLHLQKQLNINTYNFVLDKSLNYSNKTYTTMFP